MELSTSTNKPQSSSYVYKHVAHVEYPQMVSPFEVSPTPDHATCSRAPASGVNKNTSERLTQLSYGVDRYPKSYMPFQSTMEPELPGYSRAAEIENNLCLQQEQIVVSLPPHPIPAPTTTDIDRSLLTEEWQYNLFDCVSYLNTCICAFFCTPCLVGRTSSLMRQEDAYYARRLSHQSLPIPYIPSMQKDDLQTSNYVNSTCMLFTACSLFTGGIGACFYNFSNRAEIRDRYAIRGTDLDDGFVSCCCLCCVVGQQDLEVRSRILNRSKR